VAQLQGNSFENDGALPDRRWLRLPVRERLDGAMLKSIGILLGESFVSSTFGFCVLYMDFNLKKGWMAIYVALPVLLVFLVTLLISNSTYHLLYINACSCFLGMLHELLLFF
jgi:hypothetical protein